MSTIGNAPEPVTIIALLVAAVQAEGIVTADRAQEAQPTIEDLAAAVDALGGVMTVELKVLRDAQNHKRVGNRVAERINQAIRRVGLEYYPAIQTDQTQKIRLYRRGSKVDQILHAARDIDPRSDEVLRRAASAL